MKNFLFFFSLLFTASCLNIEEPEGIKLIINKVDIAEIYFQCLGTEKPIISEHENYIFDRINSAKCIGPVKGIAKQRMTIISKNKDTIKIRLLDNHFK